MADDAIEREIFICAGIERVWSLVSKAGFWVGDDLHFDADADEGETVVIDTAAYGRFRVRVDRLQPPHYAAYRWASGFLSVDPAEGNSTLVEFTLVEQDGGVLLRIKESGFASLAGTEDFHNSRLDDNAEGWTMQIERLRRVAEGVSVP
ncbi:MAG: SRPBCC domain-containing protein [Dehalococcoidia bacterium]